MVSHSLPSHFAHDLLPPHQLHVGILQELNPTGSIVFFRKSFRYEKKINYLRFSPFNHEIIAYKGFQICKKICNISFRSQETGKTLALRFF